MSCNVRRLLKTHWNNFETRLITSSVQYRASKMIVRAAAETKADAAGLGIECPGSPASYFFVLKPVLSPVFFLYSLEKYRKCRTPSIIIALFGLWWPVLCLTITIDVTTRDSCSRIKNVFNAIWKWNGQGPQTKK